VWVEGEGQAAAKVKGFPIKKGFRAYPSGWWTVPGKSFVLVRLVHEPTPAQAGKELFGKNELLTLPEPKK